MKNALNMVLAAVTIGLFVSPVYAEDKELELAKKNIVKNFKGVNPQNIFPSPVPGLYEVAKPPRFFYVSADGRYVVDGDLIEKSTQINISQGPRNISVAAAINAIDEDSMIIFGDKSLKHTVTVFTDIDCVYCRKLHNEIKKYNDLGIRIRYMAYPRAGIGSPSFKKIEDVWCSKDRKKAMTLAKSGKPVKSIKCKSPVTTHLSLVYLMGISGTPALILENGQTVPGYIPAARLSEALNKMTR
ncbi:MAG: DsbC family protein [Gammaproteobacteria bacterium]|nr:DsbC family protein [Gammaproteobacteria bacterium]